MKKLIKWIIYIYYKIELKLLQIYIYILIYSNIVQYQCYPFLIIIE